MVGVAPREFGRCLKGEVSVGAHEDLFAGVRASDLRFDNVHILAEYIARAQRFADSATRIEASAEQLVQGAMETAEEGVRQFQAALRQMQSEFKALQNQLRRVVDAAGRDIAKAVADAHASGASYILQAGEVANQRYEGLARRADQINLAAERLEQAAEKAEENRQLAHMELEQLGAFKSELVRFERESLARIADARASLYQGVGLWQRLCYVPFPPIPVLHETKVPSRPSPPSRGVRTQNAPPKVRDRSDAPAGGAARAGEGRSK